MPLFAGMSQDATLFDLFSMYPRIYAPLVKFCQELLRGDGPIAPSEREFIFAYVSRLNECDYCCAGHSRVAYKMGIAEGAIDQAIEDIDTADVTEKLKPLMRYAEKVNRTPVRVDRSDVEDVYRAGWTADALHQVVAICALANFMNRLADGCGFISDSEGAEKRAALFVQHGYFLPSEDES